jgi:hypothetical protein
MPMRRGLAATLAAAGLGLLAAAPAQASFHLMDIREVATNPAGPNTSYIELQMYAPGQNLVNGHKVTFYTATGTLLASFTLDKNVTGADSQDTILIGDTATAGTPDFTYEQLGDAVQTFGPGGAACWDTIDCVSWGAFSGAGALPSPVGTPAAAITDGSALVRSIAPGCATLLEARDATDTSSTDFALGTPSPRNNSVTPTEKECTGGGGDTTAPNTTITKAPDKKTTKTKAKFKFTSTENGSTFECSVDKGEFKACSSPTTFKKLAPGKHRFAVRAIDAAGNTDASPAKAKWKVLEKK